MIYQPLKCPYSYFRKRWRFIWRCFSLWVSLSLLWYNNATKLWNSWRCYYWQVQKINGCLHAYLISQQLVLFLNSAKFGSMLIWSKIRSCLMQFFEDDTTFYSKYIWEKLFNCSIAISGHLLSLDYFPEYTEWSPTLLGLVLW